MASAFFAAAEVRPPSILRLLKPMAGSWPIRASAHNVNNGPIPGRPNHSIFTGSPLGYSQSVASRHDPQKGNQMARTTKAQREAEAFRARIIELLADPDWLNHEHVHEWLQKLSRRDPRLGYSPAERAAVARIIAARTPFEAWDEYSVKELITAAARYIADFSYEDELFLKELQTRNCTALRLEDMRQLVGLARVAGVEVARFKPDVDRIFDEAA